MNNDKWVKNNISNITTIQSVHFNAWLRTDDSIQTVWKTVTIHSWDGPALFPRNVIFSWQLHIKTHQKTSKPNTIHTQSKVHSPKNIV